MATPTMSTLSNAIQEVPLSLDHIIPLDFQSVEGVPDSHVWSKLNDFSDFVASNDVSIPIIDLMDPNVEQLIANACETWGVFRLINHDIPSTLIDMVESHTRKLFALPIEIKTTVLPSPGDYTGYGTLPLSKFFSKLFWHEGFTIVGSPVVHARKLWPHGYESFCDVMETYQEKMKDLGHKIFLLMLKSLGVSEDELNWKASNSKNALQLNSFPTCPTPKSAIGLAEHTDSSLLTILHQSPTKGLQVFRDGVGWITVAPMAGSLVINTGDLIHIYSNGRFPSVRHRVLVNQDQHRYSFAFFYGPPMDSQIAPFAKCPIYRSVTAKEFMKLKYQGKHLLPLHKILE